MKQQFGFLGDPIRPEMFLSARNFKGGTISAAEIIMDAGGVLRSVNYEEGVAGWKIVGTGDAFFNDVTVRGDLVSGNWDGDDPADLSSFDSGATQGFYFDSSVGAGQLMGDFFLGGNLEMRGNGTFMTDSVANRRLQMSTTSSPNASIIQWMVPGSTHNPGGIYSIDADAGAGVNEQVVWVGPELISNPGVVGIALNENGPVVFFSEDTPTNLYTEFQMQIRVADGSSTSHSITRANSPNNEGIYWNASGLVVEIDGALVAEFYDNGLRLNQAASAGSASFPALTFDNDTDLGLYRSAANALSIAAGGAQVAVFNSSGLVVVENFAAGDSASVASNIAGNFFADDVTNVRAIRGNYNNSEATDRVLDIVTDQGGAGTTHLYIQANGNVLNTNNSYGAISDRRLKVKSSIKMSRSYLEDLRKLKVRKYRFKKQKEVLLGFIADEVAEVFPGMVETSKERDGGYQSVKTTVLIPMLVTAVQELTDRIEKVEALPSS